MRTRLRRALTGAALALGCVLAVHAGAGLPQQAHEELTLWYRAPAGTWTEALPIGNGRLGAMVFGGTDTERLQLNESTLYSGDPHHTFRDIDVRPEFDRVVALLRSGQYRTADSLIARRWLGRNMNNYQPLGDLHIAFPTTGAVSAYRRELDLGSAIARTQFRRGGVTYTREVFASHPDRVIVLRLTADRANALTFTARLTSVHPTAVTKGSAAIRWS